jgi:hypothetical protein
VGSYGRDLPVVKNFFSLRKTIVPHFREYCFFFSVLFKTIFNYSAQFLTVNPLKNKKYPLFFNFFSKNSLFFARGWRQLFGKCGYYFSFFKKFFFETLFVSSFQGFYVFFFFSGLLIVIFFFIMATLIKLGSYNSNYRRIHGYLGYYVVAPVSFIFLSSAVKTEMQVPGPVQQKISRLALPIFCIFVLYRVVQAASKRQIDAHLHYLVAFWGIVCGAGPFRSIALVIGWWKECEVK